MQELSLLEMFEAKRKAEKLSVPRVSDILDIPKDRIYSWKKQKTNPKYDDAVKLKKWLNNHTSQIDNQLNDEKVVSFFSSPFWVTAFCAFVCILFGQFLRCVSPLI